MDYEHFVVAAARVVVRPVQLTVPVPRATVPIDVVVTSKHTV